MNEPTPTALIVEDEPVIRRFVRMSLQAENWRVFEADTLKRGLIEAGTRRPDLIILDLGLPDGDGLTYLSDLRAWSATPVIVLSARTNEIDKITALDAGANDYLTKPFGMGELLARVRVVMRRGSTNLTEGHIYTFGDVTVDFAARQVRRKNALVHLTPIEYRLLSTLIAGAGKVLTYDYLLREVWGPTQSENAHYVRVYMGHLRQKLELDPTRPKYLITETSVGYRLLPD
ncbi:two-component system response regulator KdpE [Allopusillimonas ginsengisoli]|uniref:two-component system response regulator KdpE n=1 Tax=Allopusillimonas ginsengisoli TaxID=453575 RepID=UPI0039C1BEBA